MRDGKEVASRENPPKRERILPRNCDGPDERAPFPGDGLFAVVRAVGAKIRKGVAGTGLFAVIGCNYMTKVVVA
jgi:hypothetical protein